MPRKGKPNGVTKAVIRTGLVDLPESFTRAEAARLLGITYDEARRGLEGIEKEGLIERDNFEVNNARYRKVNTNGSN